MSTRTTIVLAAGGTGGHVFPAEALAAVLLQRGWRLAFVTDRRGGGWSGALGKIETHHLSVLAPVGGFGRKIASGMSMIAGVFAARRLLRRLHPAAVVGFGGYPALAPTLAAAQLGIPVVIHEQNAVLGRANRAVSRRADAIATSFPTVRFLPSGPLVRLTGNPVRPAVLTLRDSAYRLPEPGSRLAILVTGGSQGAAIFASVVPDAIGRLTAELRARIQIVQQARPENVDAVRAAYAGLGVDATVAAFFTDLPERLRHAQLVICRAGASTVAELAVMGRPAILVPFPFAMDDHQNANAAALADAGGGWHVPNSAFTADDLAQRLTLALHDGEPLAKAAAAAHKFGRPDATERLADLVEEFARRNGMEQAA
jgi:UDP-N-acetylglucosamine--N-acetylmuramyl-(pentapeptide) pyrophosphoryl-undecaprenol N-acetylglucosamine transferase